jgi:hypothetical protein
MTPEQRADSINKVYSMLADLLDREPAHDADCVWRCLKPDCRADHGCDTCAPEEEL